MRNKNRFTVIIEYSVKYDVSTEYEWSRKQGFCKHYELDKVQERRYMEVFYKDRDTEETAVAWAKKWIMEDIRKNSFTKKVAVRWDSISA